MEKVIKPWGWYETLCDEEKYKVKKIHINPGLQISLQFHLNRDEHWFAITDGYVYVRNTWTYLPKYESIDIWKTEIHRAKATDNPFLFIEIQTGICSEEDIVRLSDDFGRTGGTDG